MACKRDPMIRDRDETETLDFQSETRSRPRPSHVSTRPRRDRDVGKLRLETVSRPRRRDRDYIPGNDMHEGRRQQLISIHIITTRWSRRPIAATIACMFTRCNHRGDRVYVYMERSSRRSVERPIAAIDRARPIAATIAPCKHAISEHFPRHFRIT